MPTASPMASPNGMASSTDVRLGGLGLLDRPALALPARHAAVDDVDDLSAPKRWSRLAATAERWPEPQMAATGRAGSMPSGTSWMSW